MTNPSRVAFTLFGKDIYWYGILMAVGIVIGVLLAQSESKRKKLYEDAMIDMCLITIPLGVIGARIYYVLFELDNYLKDPITILYIWQGGLAIYGAIIGGLLGILIFSRKKHIRYLKLLDCIAPGLVLAQSIGRWGNFFNQEAYGNPVTNEAMQWFPLTVRIDGYHMFNGAVCTEPYHLATFFYESLWCLIIFILVWSQRKKFKHDGDAFLCYAIMYAFERMFVEGLRGDSLYIGSVRVSQLLSALLFAAGVVFVIVRASKEKKLGTLIWPAPEPEAAAEGEAAAAEDKAEPEDGGADDGDAGDEKTGDDADDPGDDDDDFMTPPDDDFDDFDDAPDDGEDDKDDENKKDE